MTGGKESIICEFALKFTEKIKIQKLSPRTNKCKAGGSLIMVDIGHIVSTHKDFNG
jgi:hypothetical protein